MIRGIGTDIVEISRIENIIKKYSNRFRKKIFTENEWEYCYSKKNPVPSVAARFAAKEAVLKAMGLGMGKCKWQDIEVYVEESGNPGINLKGDAALIARQQLISTFNLSLSHSNNNAIAFVVVE